MSIEVAAWNVAKAFGDAERAPQAFEGIKRLGAGIVVLSEAYATDNSTSVSFGEDVESQVKNFADAHGYQTQTTAYKDADTTRPGAPAGFEQYLTVMHRGLHQPYLQPVRLATRNAFELQFMSDDAGHDPAVVQVIGTHFDDRKERFRIGMATAALERSNLHEPAMLLGDLNAMHDGTRPARFMRSRLAAAAANHAPSARVRSLGSRLIEMADGRTLAMLTDAGLTDADPRHQSTFVFSGVSFGQLDHILTSRSLKTSNFRARRLAGSDHKAISATATVAEG